MSRLRVVIAPDSFKGSLGAPEVAAALAAGWSRSRPDDVVVTLPLADGGEGTLDAFERACPGSVRHESVVEGPDGRPVDAPWLTLPDGTAVVELASSCGLGLLSSPAPHDANTRGLGDVIRAAVDAGATRLVVGLGGSASTDGGAGALTVLGARIVDSLGEPVASGNHGLTTAARVDLSGLIALPPDGVTLLVDVDSPLLGPDGAAAVFGPQKGASVDDVLALEQGLERFASLVDVDPTTPGAGAAGGTGFGLLAWGARLQPGAVAVAETVRLAEALAHGDVVVTGEGSFDGQTAAGKTVSLVRRMADAVGVPVVLVAGAVDAPADGFADAVSTTQVAGGVAESTTRASYWVGEAAAQVAGRWAR
ncbi:MULTISPECIES: glycerate kinase [unclassified Frigoribacterium]|uniref:glycerate kinase n=1 Tax=unclassified Frigoribacterium TaxID=2627005 RepID=UPI00226DEE49|nr:MULTISPECIES: glycerate kinase [unclassified Frigoribacterium]WAC52844.1 glycerate kinase [Frigoribacterium sp. SL97]